MRGNLAENKVGEPSDISGIHRPARHGRQFQRVEEGLRGIFWDILNFLYYFSFRQGCRRACRARSGKKETCLFLADRTSKDTVAVAESIHDMGWRNKQWGRLETIAGAGIARGGGSTREIKLGPPPQGWGGGGGGGRSKPKWGSPP